MDTSKLWFKAKVMDDDTSYSEMNGKWIGGYYQVELMNGEIQHLIQHIDVSFRVDPKTVCQWSGFKIDNCNLYDNDVIRFRVPEIVEQNIVDRKSGEIIRCEIIGSEIVDYSRKVEYKDGMYGIYLRADTFTTLNEILKVKVDETSLRSVLDVDITNDDEWWNNELSDLIDGYECGDVDGLLEYINDVKILKNIHDV